MSFRWSSDDIVAGLRIVCNIWQQVFDDPPNYKFESNQFFYDLRDLVSHLEDWGKLKATHPSHTKDDNLAPSRQQLEEMYTAFIRRHMIFIQQANPEMNSTRQGRWPWLKEAPFARNQISTLYQSVNWAFEREEIQRLRKKLHLFVEQDIYKRSSILRQSNADLLSIYLLTTSRISLVSLVLLNLKRMINLLEPERKKQEIDPSILHQFEQALIPPMPIALIDEQKTPFDPPRGWFSQKEALDFISQRLENLSMRIIRFDTPEFDPESGTSASSIPYVVSLLERLQAMRSDIGKIFEAMGSLLDDVEPLVEDRPHAPLQLEFESWYMLQERLKNMMLRSPDRIDLGPSRPSVASNSTLRSLHPTDSGPSRSPITFSAPSWFPLVDSSSSRSSVAPSSVFGSAVTSSSISSWSSYRSPPPSKLRSLPSPSLLPLRSSTYLQRELPAHLYYLDKVIQGVIESITRFDDGEVRSIQSVSQNGHIRIQHSVDKNTPNATESSMKPFIVNGHVEKSSKMRVQFQGSHLLKITARSGDQEEKVRRLQASPIYKFHNENDFLEFQALLLNKEVKFCADVQFIKSLDKDVQSRLQTIQILQEPFSRARYIIYFKHMQGQKQEFVEWPIDLFKVPKAPTSKVKGLTLYSLDGKGLSTAKGLSRRSTHEAVSNIVSFESTDGPAFGRTRLQGSASRNIRGLVIEFHEPGDCYKFWKEFTTKDTTFGQDFELSGGSQNPRILESLEMLSPNFSTRAEMGHQENPSAKGKMYENPKYPLSPGLKEISPWNEPWVQGHGVIEIRDIIVKRLSHDTAIHEPAGLRSSPVEQKWNHLLPWLKTDPSDSEVNRLALHTASFNVHWKLREFLQQQFGASAIPPLGSLIALTGSAICAQATTIKDYLNQTWPRSTELLTLLEKEFSSSGKFRNTKGPARETWPTGLKFHSEVDQDVWVVNGPVENIVNIAQQLAWLGSAMSTSKTGRIGRSQARVVVSASLEPSFDISFRVDDLPDGESCCWHDLFVNPVIAYNFPISDRGIEVGLEIPIPMMAALGGAAHAVEFEGGLLIKGFSGMFVPFKRFEDSIQWHFIYKKDDSRLPYWEVTELCPERALLDTVNQASLSSTRAFLGWWGETTTNLGTAGANYENISWSATRDPTRSMTFSGGSIGFQNFGAGELNFSVAPKDSKFHVSRSGSYQRIIKHASRTPVVLYDPAENDKRAWLVPGSAVIAHIAQTKHFRDKFKVDGVLVDLKPTDPAAGVYDAAERMLIENSETVLDRDISGQSTFYFRDLVHGTWSMLETLMDHDIKREAGDPAIPGTTRRKLRGWEFMDLVDERSPIRMKETSVDSSAGGWIKLVKDINAVILFASGFEDIIIPKEDGQMGLCHMWKRVPKGRDYMTASVAILDILFEQAGSRLTREHISSTHLKWHRGPKLFESCSSGTAFQCNCDRVQQIVHESRLSFGRGGNIVPPGPLEERGAAIFGQPTATFTHPIFLKQKQSAKTSIYSLTKAQLGGFQNST